MAGAQDYEAYRVEFREASKVDVRYSIELANAADKTLERRSLGAERAAQK